MIKSIRREPIKYIPEFGGNRDDEDPTWVMITPLDREEADRYAKRTRFSQAKGSKNKEWESNAIDIQKQQFIANVKEVHNFYDSDEDKIMDIDNISKFYKTAPNGFVEEIIGVLLDVSKIEDDERKN